MRFGLVVAAPLLITAPLFAVTSARADWPPDSRLTNDPASSRTEVDGGRNVIVSDQILMVVWSDTRDGNAEIYFQERIAGNWSPALRLTNNAASSTHPAISQIQGEVRVVWEDSRTGHPEIRMKRKVFGEWLTDACLTCDGFESARPSLDHTGEHLVWEETKDGNREIYYRRLLFDEPWEDEFRISNDAAESSHPSMASPRLRVDWGDPGIRLVAWQDQRDGNWEIYARYGTFSGWGPEKRVSNDAASSQFPSAAVEDDAFCSDIAFVSQWVAWQDDRLGYDEVYFAEGFDGFWEPEFLLSTTSAPSRHPSVGKAYVPFAGPFGGSGFCGVPAVIWEEETSATSGAILYQTFTAAEPETISAIVADPKHASIAAFHESTSPGILEGALAVVWTDERDGNEEVYLAEESILMVGTGVPELPLETETLEIGLAHPNPFDRATTATVAVPTSCALTVRIVDAAGRLVRKLFSGTVPGGPHSFTWDGVSRSGTRTASGTYFFVAESEGRTGVRPVIRVR